GSFAIVYEGVERMTGETVAVKQIKKRGTQRSAIQKEVDIMAKLNHENIVKFHEHFDDDEYLSIILEFVRGGDLRDYRKTHGVLPEFLVKSVASQVLSAVGYLHQQGVTHRDIKPENILVSSKNPLVVKLTDFGLAKAIANDQSMLKTFCGTMLYLAPEVFPEHYLKAANKGSYTQSIDIWAIGCVLYFLLTDRHPFDCGDDRELTLSRICNAQYDIQLLEQHSSSAFECTDFISRMLQVEPRFRISDTEALVHPYLGGEASP
ncbi:Pkinase-domain-containing protein, partial [Ascobolus immersus RN42]